MDEKTRYHINRERMVALGMYPDELLSFIESKDVKTSLDCLLFNFLTGTNTYSLPDQPEHK